MTRRLRMHFMEGADWMPSWTCDHCGAGLQLAGRAMWNAVPKELGPGGLAYGDFVGACSDECEAWIRANVDDVETWGTMTLPDFIFYLMGGTHTMDAVASKQADLSLARKLREFNEEQP